MENKLIKIIHIVDEKPPFQSVNLLQSLLYNALQKNFSVTQIVSGSFSQDEYSRLLKEHHIILGLDQELLQARYRNKISIPCVFLSYGLGTRGLLFLWFLRDLLQVGDSYIFPSSADYLAASTHLTREDITLNLVPYCVEPIYFEELPQDHSKLSLAQEFGLTYSPDMRWLCYVGRINQQKNIHLLLYMINELKSLKHNVHLLIAGSEDESNFPEMNWENSGYSDDLKKLIDNLGLSEQIHFLGDLDARQIRRVYALSEVNVTCSTFRTEDFGFVPIEAMASGLPTVGPSWGGFWDTIEHGVTGFRFPVYLSDTGFRLDWKLGVTYIDELLSNQVRYKSLRRGCLATATAKYTPELFAERLRKMILDILEEKKDIVDPVDMLTLIDKDTAMFFADLDEGAKKGDSSFIARKGQFEKDKMKRIKLFFSEYVRVLSYKLAVNDIIYMPVPLEISYSSAKILDRIWPISIDISPLEYKLLQNIDGNTDMSTLISMVGCGFEEGLKNVVSLMKKGLAIPVGESGLDKLD